MLATAPAPVLITEQEQDRTLHLMVLAAPSPEDDKGRGEAAQILAMYGGARVVEDFPLRNRKGDRSSSGFAGTRFSQIIDVHDRISLSLDSMPDKTGKVPTLPNSEELRRFGMSFLEETVHRPGPPSLRSRAARNKDTHRSISCSRARFPGWRRSHGNSPTIPISMEVLLPRRFISSATCSRQCLPNGSTGGRGCACWWSRRSRKATAPLGDLRTKRNGSVIAFNHCSTRICLEIEVLAHVTAERLHERIFSELARTSLFRRRPLHRPWRIRASARRCRWPGTVAVPLDRRWRSACEHRGCCARSYATGASNSCS